MGELGILGLIMLIVIMATPVAIAVGAIVYVVRVARKGIEATLTGARRRRELA
ncbi:MAG: hypothetical protein M0026_06565 [Nocardiopsaceae bacterium]|nr:hypothetical protein [Nocardiopsaceae bacterium]